MADPNLNLVQANMQFLTEKRAYLVNLRISSRARGITQRAYGAWIYLIDSKGRRYAPEPDPSQPPLDIRHGRGESVATARTFRVPDGVH